MKCGQRHRDWKRGIGMGKTGEKLLSVAQMAKILKITPQGVRKSIKEGRLKGAFKVGAYWVIKRRSI